MPNNEVLLDAQGSLPAGFEWTRPPNEWGVENLLALTTRYVVFENPGVGQATFQTRYAALTEWAEENGLELVALRERTLANPRRENGVEAVHTQFRAFPPGGAQAWYGGRTTPWNHLPDKLCHSCGEEHPHYTRVCPETNEWIRCLCGADEFYPTYFHPTDGARCCTSCGVPCRAEGCEIPSQSGLCHEHGVQGQCSLCYSVQRWLAGEEPLIQEALVEARTFNLCEPCRGRICPHCTRISDSELVWTEQLDGVACRRCVGSIFARMAEEFDGEPTSVADLPTIPGREQIRMCGVEIEGREGTRGGGDLAEAFYDAGISSMNRVGSYHTGTGGGFAHVENDSSVDWEAVIGPINMAEERDVIALNSAVSLIRERIRDGRLRLDLNSGLHIHVGAERVGIGAAFNLNTLFGYCEDTLYRLAAAKWPLHRACNDPHYCQPVLKEERKLAFAQIGHESRNNRYFGLSFNNYFNAMLSQCGCGAVRYDSWESCTCTLQKCTFEFRLFNSTANPRKLHAYLALCQAMVAKALSLDEIQDAHTNYPPQTFLPRPFKSMEETEQQSLMEGWRERLTWMFSELPLTDAEKESILYCVRNSELGALETEFIDNLITTTQEVPA